jgi:hypothetical protein
MRHVLLLMLAPLILQAGPPLPIEWEMTTAAFGGRKAIVKLDTGARIEGVWLGVTPSTFTMDVKRTKGKNRPPKGVQTIDRGAIVELRLHESRIRREVTGTLLGTAIGLHAADYAAVSTSALMSTGASTAVFLTVWVSVITTARLVGRWLDKKSRRVVIIEPAC